jgi:hypothetical protein
VAEDSPRASDSTHGPASSIITSDMAVVNVTGALGGGSEPCRQVAEQVVLVFADPCDVTVRPEQDRGRVQFPADVRDVADPIRPSGHGELAGLVQQEPAAFTSEFAETAPDSGMSRSRLPSSGL